MNLDEKLEQIYSVSQRTRGKAPTVDELDVNKLDYLVKLISTELDEWLNLTFPEPSWQTDFWVDSRGELNSKFFTVENKDGEEMNCITEYMEEACSRVSKLKSGNRFKLGWNVEIMDEHVQIQWYVSKVDM